MDSTEDVVMDEQAVDDQAVPTVHGPLDPPPVSTNDIDNDHGDEDSDAIDPANIPLPYDSPLAAINSLPLVPEPSSNALTSAHMDVDAVFTSDDDQRQPPAAPNPTAGSVVDAAQIPLPASPSPTSPAPSSPPRPDPFAACSGPVRAVLSNDELCGRILRAVAARGVSFWDLAELATVASPWHRPVVDVVWEQVSVQGLVVGLLPSEYRELYIRAVRTIIMPLNYEPYVAAGKPDFSAIAELQALCPGLKGISCARDIKTERWSMDFRAPTPAFWGDFTHTISDTDPMVHIAVPTPPTSWDNKSTITMNVKSSSSFISDEYYARFCAFLTGPKTAGPHTIRPSVDPRVIKLEIAKFSVRLDDLASFGRQRTAAGVRQLELFSSRNSAPYDLDALQEFIPSFRGLTKLHIDTRHRGDTLCSLKDIDRVMSLIEENMPGLDDLLLGLRGYDDDGSPLIAEQLPSALSFKQGWLQNLDLRIHTKDSTSSLPLCKITQIIAAIVMSPEDAPKGKQNTLGVQMRYQRDGKVYREDLKGIMPGVKDLLALSPSRKTALIGADCSVLGVTDPSQFAKVHFTRYDQPKPFVFEALEGSISESWVAEEHLSVTATSMIDQIADIRMIGMTMSESLMDGSATGQEREALKARLEILRGVRDEHAAKMKNLASWMDWLERCL